MRTSARRIKVLLLGAFAALAMSGAPLLRADPAAAPPEPKDHTLFMGLNLSIEDGGAFYKILGTAGNSAVIRTNGQLKQIPFVDIRQYQLKLELMVAGVPATVDHFVGERAYTPAHDPKRIWRNRETQITGYTDDQDSALERQFALDAAFLSGKYIPGGGPGAVPQPNPLVAAAMQKDANALSQGLDNESQDLGDDSYFERRMQEDLDKRLFDAIEVSFEVSSPEELVAPYAVILAEFRESEKAAATARWIYIKPLRPIDAQPTRVHVLQGGFPPGFALGKIEVHLYDRAREIPTNAAARKVALTRGDVIKFAAIQYLHEHRGQTLRPTPMHDSVPSGLRDEIDPARLREEFEVEINPDGGVVRVSATSDSGPVPQGALELWRKLRFYPALEKGAPVAATVNARLADFLE